MMGTLFLICVLVALALVMASGVWVAVALFTAVRGMKPPARSTPRDPADKCSE